MQTLTHGDKQIKLLHGGKLVVVAPLNNDKIIVPFYCPVCEYPMKTADDAQSYRDHQCCSMCELYWGKGLSIPDKASERWKLYLERRHMAFLPQINFG
jgi:hypothetical protein